MAVSSASAWPRRLLGCLGEQEPGGLERLPDPTGGVEPRREGERDRVEVEGGGRDPGPLEQGRDAGPRVGPQALEPEPGDGAVLADDRGDVGDRADRREVGQVERGTAAAAGSWATLKATPLPASRAIGIERVRVDAG